jgi:hypothetical protein
MTRAFVVLYMAAMAGCSHVTVAKTAPPSPHDDVAVLLESDPSTWVKTGERPELYTWSTDPNVLDHGRPTMRFERAARPESTGDAWAATVASVSGHGFVGRRIRFTANVRTDGATDGANVWLRLDHEGQRTLCNLQSPTDLRLKGTHDFTPLTCVLDVPSGTSNIAFGLGLAGPGRAWIGPATIDEVGRSVAETPHSPAFSSTHALGNDWAAGWVMSGGAHDEYETKSDPDVMRSGHATLRLAPTADTHDRYGTSRPRRTMGRPRRSRLDRAHDRPRCR